MPAGLINLESTAKNTATAVLLPYFSIRMKNNTAIYAAIAVLLPYFYRTPFRPEISSRKCRFAGDQETLKSQYTEATIKQMLTE